MNDANKNQTDLLTEFIKLNKYTKPKQIVKKRDSYESINTLYEGRKKGLNGFRSGMS